jgi:nucleotidyltransferase substrate binding protein (TIGR01987 family)
MVLDLSGLQRALGSLDEAVLYFANIPEGINPDIVRDSVIQRFEYTYELSWKFLQRWIKINTSPEDADPRTKKDLFRLAAKKHMIADPSERFEFAEARNSVAHTYNESSAQYVYEVALKFLPVAKKLYEKLEQHND